MTRKCKNCGEEMEKISLPYGQGVEYSCDNCNDYRNANGRWRSQDADEPGNVVKEVFSDD